MSMWRRSADFNIHRNVVPRPREPEPVLFHDSASQNPIPETSAYNQTHPAHHGIGTNAVKLWTLCLCRPSTNRSSSTAVASQKTSAYNQTHAAHHGIVTSNRAQAAVWAHSPNSNVRSTSAADSGGGSRRQMSVIDIVNKCRQPPDFAEAVAAIRALAAVIRASEATTMMELEIELKEASDSLKAQRVIAMFFQDYIFYGCTILVHGFSGAVLEVLKSAVQNKKVFRVFCTEGSPNGTGLRLLNELAKLNVSAKLLLDSAVAYAMDAVDMVLVGADGVVKSGGIISLMGTYQIAIVAHGMNKPVYVAAESYKFARLNPLDQKNDKAPASRPIDLGMPIPSKVELETSARDYTPPQYLKLLFTDLGVLTPSVVGDELIQQIQGLCVARI